MNLDQQRKKLLHDLERIRARSPEMYRDTVRVLQSQAAESLNRLHWTEKRAREMANLEANREKMTRLKSRYPKLYHEFMDEHYFPAKERMDKQLKRKDRAHFLREVDILALRYGIKETVLRWDGKGRRTRISAKDVDQKRIPNEMLMVATEYVDHPQGRKVLMKKYKITERLARSLIDEAKERAA
jgi:hypothetical protein